MKTVALSGVRAADLHGGSARTDPRDVRAQAAEYLAGWQRSRADYENLRKRVAAETTAAVTTATDELLVKLLPLADFFELAVRDVPPAVRAHPWAEGIRQIHRALDDFLAAAGIERVVESGVAPDPKRHEVIGTEPAEAPAGTVTTVALAGYRRQGRVLRSAKVKVSSGPRAKEPTGPPPDRH